MNSLLPKKLSIKHAINKYGTELDILTYEALSNSDLLCFTLKTDKVYVGWVKELSDIRYNEFVRIFPLFSGYRNEKRNIVFTTNYFDLYTEKHANVSNILDVTIKINEIVTIANFDLAIYEKINKKPVIRN